jgi:hypothetical protein
LWPSAGNTSKITAIMATSVSPVGGISSLRFGQGV